MKYSNVLTCLENSGMRMHAPCFVAPEYAVEGIMTLDNNGCNLMSKCGSNVVLITSNPTPDGKKNYSCQCSCGVWCTNGHGNPGDAVNEYIRMSEAYLRSMSVKTSLNDMYGDDLEVVEVIEE